MTQYNDRAFGDGAARVRMVLPPRVGPRFAFRAVFCVAIGIVALLWGGCSGPAGDKQRPSDTAAQDDSEPETSAEKSLPEPVAPADLARIVAEHRGKVVLVDYWATWCSSCVAMLSHVVELSQRWEPRGLVTIAVSLDLPSQREQVGRFLQAKKIPFRSLISNEENLQQAFVAFDLESLPTYRVFDRSGKLRATLSGDFRADDLDRAVLEALDSPSPD